MGRTGGQLVGADLVGPRGTSGSDPAPAAPRPLATPQLSERKVQILDGLEAIVLEEGFRALRLTELARRLATSNTTLYQLASTKDELILLVIDRWYQNNGRRTWERVSTATNPADRLRRWLLGGVQGGAMGSRAFWDDVASHVAMSELSTRYRRYYVSIIERLVREGVEAGVFKPVGPRMAALVFDAAAVRLHDPRETSAVDTRMLEQRGRQLIDLLFHGILKAA